MKKLILTATIFFALIGNAISQESPTDFGQNLKQEPFNRHDNCTSKYSYAMCLLTWLNLDGGISDSKMDALPDVFAYAKPVNSNLDSAASFAVAATEFSKLPSLLHGAFGAVMLIDAMSDSTPSGRLPHTFFLITEKDFPGVDPKDFAKKAGVLAKDAVVAGLKEVLKADSATHVEKSSTYLFTGGDICGADGCLVSARTFRLGYWTTLREENVSPVWFANHEKAYIMRDMTMGFTIVGKTKGDRLPVDIGIALARILPGWFFTYIPSKDKKIAGAIFNGEKIHFTAFEKK